MNRGKLLAKEGQVCRLCCFGCWMKLGWRSSRFIESQLGARRDDDQRDLRHLSHAQMQRSLAGLPSEYGPNNGLQSLESMGPSRRLGAHPGGVDRARLDCRDCPNRQQLRQGSPLCGRRKGARAEAIDISRGGRTTNTHALVDVLGRPVSIALIPGSTSDIKGADTRG